ncbi:hypothetical protein [Dongia sedimenti]|uniref:Oxidoreductase N-terminal domain-containing protein n=1 Tax=Dongia sedimenti TaxID=3064282 RepID=A0ABU0YXE6_9PROT|nr:hypothetical protein [Rhodospirillaceae bacterium R-7]
MTETLNRQVQLARRPQGAPVPDDFRIIDVPVPVPSEGELLLRNLCLSLDPYMRGRMNDSRDAYAPPYALGAKAQRQWRALNAYGRTLILPSPSAGARRHPGELGRASGRTAAPLRVTINASLRPMLLQVHSPEWSRASSAREVVD